MYLSVHFSELPELTKNDPNHNKSSDNITFLSASGGEGNHEGIGRWELGQKGSDCELHHKNMSLEMLSSHYNIFLWETKKIKRQF